MGRKWKSEFLWWLVSMKRTKANNLDAVYYMNKQNVNLSATALHSRLLVCRRVDDFFILGIESNILSAEAKGGFAFLAIPPFQDC